MISRFLALPIAHKFATIVAALCFISLQILILAATENNRQSLRQSSDFYAENIAEQLSRNASMPLVQQDNLRLQGVVDDMVERGIIAYGAIYDLENRPIVEAGDRLEEASDYSISISFQDSLAGYAVISVANASVSGPARHLGLKMFLLSLLLTAAVYWAAKLIGQNLANKLLYLCQPKQPPLAYRGQDELALLAKAINQGAIAIRQQQQALGEQAIMHIEINPRTKDLDAKGLKEIIRECHQQLSKICSLYDGHATVTRPDGISATFSQSDDGSHAFRALCSAYLIARLARENDPVDITVGLALTHSSPCDVSRQENIEALHTTCQQYRGHALIATAELCQQPGVSERCELAVLDDNFVAINGFNDAYAALLESQLATLRGQQKA